MITASCWSNGSRLYYLSDSASLHLSKEVQIPELAQQPPRSISHVFRESALLHMAEPMTSAGTVEPFRAEAFPTPGRSIGLAFEM
jgi:hypothetical protein